tara:strand:+ start:558 stop:1403 length:846 start_codon:yes stop_codon:yes gene_type:complete
MTTETTTEFGISCGVPFDEYRAIPAVNQSLLKNFKHSAAMVRHRIDGGTISTPALEFGTAFHAAILEPEVFAKEYAIAPVADKRTKVYKEFAKENEGRKVLSLGESENLGMMRRRIMEHPEAVRLLAGEGENEATIVWNDFKTGITCKARADRLAQVDNGLVVVDLKTTTSVATRDFSNDAAKYGYHLQAAWYLRGLAAISPDSSIHAPRRFIIIAVEKSAPHCVAVYELDQNAITAGDLTVSRYLLEWERCTERDEWPAPAGEGVETLALPAWVTVGLDA